MGINRTTNAAGTATPLAEGTAIRPFRVDVPEETIVAYPKLIYFNEVNEGDHFAAWQEPNLFTTEVRAAFRQLR